MYFAKNLIFALFFILATMILSIVACFFRFSTKKLVKVYKIWGIITLLLAKYIYGITYKIIGIENIKPNTIIASKHQSMWETIIFLVILNKVSYILKQDLLKIPFYGWHLKAMGMISVNRKGSIRAMKKMIIDARKKLKQGYNVVIFPQGSRVPYGSLPKDYRYHFSFLPLYNEGFEVIPVGLDSGKYWPKGMFSKKTSGEIQMKIFPAINKDLDAILFKNTLIELIE